MSAPPAGMPKPHPPPGGDVDIGWKLEVGTTVTFLAAAIAVGLRSLARWKYSQRGLDDYFMVFALLLALIATILDFVAVNNGLGRHTFYLTIPEYSASQYYSLLAQVFCVQALTFAKISIILAYMRVIRGSQNRWQLISLWTIGALTFVVNTLVIITLYVGCDPAEKSWNPTVKGTCWPTTTRIGFVILQGAWSAFSDFFLALFPFVMLKKLQISRSSKLAIIGLMSLGLITGIFAIVRTAESGNQLHPPPNVPPDVTYSTIIGLMWSGMERNIAILLASLPAVRSLAPPVKSFISSTFGSSRGSTTKATEGYHMSDSSKFQKLSEDNNSNRNHYPTMASSVRNNRSNMTGTTATTTSEEYMLPVQGLGQERV